MIIVEQRSDLKWTVTCDEHGAIGNGQTTSEYGLMRALEHQLATDEVLHTCFPKARTVACDDIRMFLKSGGYWKFFAPEQVWHWMPNETRRSTRRLIEKVARGQ